MQPFGCPFTLCSLTVACQGPILDAEPRYVIRARGDVGASAADPVLEVDDSALEAVHAEQLEVGTESGGKRRRATPEHDGYDEQVQLVDQPGRQGLTGELRAPDGQVMSGCLLHVPHRG